MSFLRRRILGDSSNDTSRETTPGPESGEDLLVVPAKKLKSLQKGGKLGKGARNRHLWVFGLGGLFGLAIAALFAGNNDMLDLASFTDMNLDSILDALPVGLVKDARDLQVCRSLGG